MEKYKHRVKITCGLWDSYDDFKGEYKAIHPEVTRRNYVDVCYKINEALTKKIMRESFEFKMPSRLGSLSIKKSKHKIKIKDNKLEKNKMIVDWGKTWEYWNGLYPDKTRKEINAISGKIAIYNMNNHTNGYVMKWHWDRTTCNIPNQTVYYFKPTKANRLELASWINSEDRENDYPLIKNYESRSEKKLLRALKEERVQKVGKV